MDVEQFETRERELLAGRTPQWVERWREATGALTVVRFDERVSMSLFGGVITDACADWLEPHLTRQLAGTSQLHFIDQGQLDSPNGKVRNLYIATLRERRADLGPAHVFIGSNAILRMVSSTANVVLGGLGQFHPDRPSFDAALTELLSKKN